MSRAKELLSKVDRQPIDAEQLEIGIQMEIQGGKTREEAALTACANLRKDPAFYYKKADMSQDKGKKDDK